MGPGMSGIGIGRYMKLWTTLFVSMSSDCVCVGAVLSLTHMFLCRMVDDGRASFPPSPPFFRPDMGEVRVGAGDT